MSIADKAIDAVTKNVTLSIQLKDAESKIAALQNEICNLNASLRQAEDKNASLEKKLVELHNNPLTFDDKTGAWIGSDSLCYCPKCKSSDSQSPMKNEKYGWRCPVCDYYAPDPNRPSPEPSNPGSWIVGKARMPIIR